MTAGKRAPRPSNLDTLPKAVVLPHAMLRHRLALALVFVLGGLGMGASCRNRNHTANAPDAQSTNAVGAADGARRPTPSGSLVTEVPGLEITSLSSTERETFWAVANEELSPCGDPHPLAVCARDRLPCRTCMPAMRFLARAVEEGYGRDQLAELLRLRYAASAVQQVRTEGAPTHGSPMASVTVIEFSDYECPHCARAVPILRQIERDFEGRVRVVHMNFPLDGHIHARPAARAALAAGRQGKFWEMHYKLFENQHELEPQHIERYATELGLNLEQFRRDLTAREVEAQIDATRHEGERLDIHGTPTIFINGRRYELALERDALRAWIQEEIETSATR